LLSDMALIMPSKAATCLILAPFDPLSHPNLAVVVFCNPSD
jgi:hypothetical protein